MLRVESLAVVVSLGGLALALAFGPLELAPELPVDLGPGDRRYVQGFDGSWKFDGEATWRRLTRRGRVGLPLTIAGRGTLELRIRQESREPVELQTLFDGGVRRTVTIPPSSSSPKLARVELPSGRVRARVRLRCQHVDGRPCRLDVDRVTFRGERPLPERGLVAAAFVLVPVSFVALVLGGLGPRWAVILTAMLVVSVLALARVDSFSALHLLTRAPPVALAGLVLVGLTRLFFRRAPALTAIVFFGLVVKAAFVFHPSFFFVDWPIHETLLELVYHRGIVDFWTRLPEYQVRYNLGVAPVGTAFRAFPYPASFYLLAHVGNALHHDPELWLKLTAVLVSTATLLPLAYVAGRFSDQPHVGVVAALLYLLTPAYLRSLLLLELSALLGHFFDLLAVAYLARVSLLIEGSRRFAVTVLVVLLSLAAYTSGFVHLGLFVFSALVLSPFVRALGPRDLFRLATASLLGAGCAVLSYHPDTMRALFSSILPQGVADTTTIAEAAPGFYERLHSAGARAVTFLGHASIPIGLLGWLWGFPRIVDRRLRLFFGAWALSGALAYTLRFVLLDLFHYQKELYWVGALLAVTGSALLAHLTASRAGRVFALGLALWLIAASVQAHVRLWDQFFVNYRFL